MSKIAFLQISNAQITSKIYFPYLWCFCGVVTGKVLVLYSLNIQADGRANWSWFFLCRVPKTELITKTKPKALSLEEYETNQLPPKLQIRMFPKV